MGYQGYKDINQYETQFCEGLKNEINQIYDNLKRYWGFPSNTSFKLRSPYTLKKSLNISGKTRKEKCSNQITT